MPELIFTMLKIALKLNTKNLFRGRPKIIGNSYGKMESKISLGRKFLGFCDTLNGFRAMAILLILFFMFLDRGNLYVVFFMHGSENVISALVRCCFNV